MNVTTQGFGSVARYSLSSAFQCVNFRNHRAIIKSRAYRYPGACPDSSFFSDEDTVGRWGDGSSNGHRSELFRNVK